MDILAVVAGLAGLLLGGEALVRGAVRVALGLGIAPAVIGITLVGFGTSTPELLTSLQAAFQGSPGIAVGNVVGSNSANILLILGLTALLTPIAISPDGFLRDGAALGFATLALLCVVQRGEAGIAAGGILTVALIVYLVVTIRAQPAAAPEVDAAGSLWPALGLFAVGLALTLGAAHLLVRGSVAIARDLGVSDAVIGVTLVAVGTSLPELVTSVIAARRGQPEIAFGNIVGSNIFNALGILGITAIVHPLTVPAEIARLDVWVMAGSAVLLISLVFTTWRIGRGWGAAMLAGYTAYMIVLAMSV